MRSLNDRPPCRAIALGGEAAEQKIIGPAPNKGKRTSRLSAVCGRHIQFVVLHESLHGFAGPETDHGRILEHEDNCMPAIPDVRPA